MNNLIRFSAVVINIFLSQSILFSSVFTEYKFIGDAGNDRGNNVTSGVDPNQNEINVVKSSDITLTFSQSIYISTINTSNIKIFRSQTGSLSYSLSYNSGTIISAMNPNYDFKIGEKIAVTMKYGIPTLAVTSITPYIFIFNSQSAAVYAQFSISQNPVSGCKDIKDIISEDPENYADPDVCVILANKFFF